MTASVVWRWRTELPPGASSARWDERTRFSASSNHRPLLLRHGRLTSSIVRRSPGTESPRIGGLFRLNSSRAAISDASRLSRTNTCSGTSHSSGHSPIPHPPRIADRAAGAYQIGLTIAPQLLRRDRADDRVRTRQRLLVAV